MFNNAGGSNLSPIHDYDVAEWTRIVTLNLTGDYVWASDMSETINGLRALRTTPSDLRQVA